MKEEKTKKIVKNHYKKIATGQMKNCSCGCDGTFDSEQISKAIGYSDDEMNAVPIVEVNNPKAHIAHETSLGSVDSKQLQTLMAREG